MSNTMTITLTDDALQMLKESVRRTKLRNTPMPFSDYAKESFIELIVEGMDKKISHVKYGTEEEVNIQSN